MIKYERFQYGEKVVTYPIAVESAVEQLVTDFWYDVCARGIVYDEDTKTAYIVQDHDRLDIPFDYNIITMEATC
jgi:hypothetical protein